MYKDLITMLERPPLYTKTTIPFWDDEHISKQMLKAHLDPNYEGASRKLQFIEKSVLWIKEIVPASRYRQLIDIGCGPGIYAERFAQEGYRVTGVDFSRRSIDYAMSSAKAKNVDISYLWQDYLKLKISKTFDLATMIYCDYGALSTTDRIAIMRTVFTHLRPGGRFLLDVFSLAEFKRFEETQTWELCIDGGFWYKEPHVVCDGHYKYPDNVTLDHTTVISNNTVHNYYLWNTYFSRETLVKEATDAGFKVCGLYGDVAGETYSKDSPTIAILLEK
ncbi:class I SAM-dependent methyltransferase [Intestinimonas butyriciproducens]|uniref:class I SAM-dependent methyltransferase n=1 Tax=Intestinimonas butyriciproducens TaxID=1297617 RepID=UPI0018A98F67|nr:methyltransferase domain-containing protein [Intestinimonas butyriciproducens]MDB7816004.1 methyltransferase domain-containing protein [Intestinimonas butyriciproducens]MDB7843226.1 methyltransferase domain-containing protein [Intestinimonas butyriciproducens]MDB7857026.1 methyltransferase domain-containing protein [Intestinimonas butyriciproducens]